MKPLVQFDVSEKPCTIEPVPGTDNLFRLLCEGREIATSTNTRWLSHSAMDSGARFVRFAFDLNLLGD